MKSKELNTPPSSTPVYFITKIYGPESYTYLGREKKEQNLTKLVLCPEELGNHQVGSPKTQPERQGSSPSPHLWLDMAGQKYGLKSIFGSDSTKLPSAL